MARKNGVATLLAPFNPVPAVVGVAEQLARYEKLDPKIKEARALAEAHFSSVDERTLEEHVGPLIWTWTCNLCIPPITCLPNWPPLGWPPPFLPGWPPQLPPGWPPQLPPFDPNWWWIGPVPLDNGSLVLQGTQILLDGALSYASIEELGTEVARWSGRSTRNADRLTAVQQEFHQFLDECSRLQEERKAPIVAGIAIAAVAIGSFALGYAAMR